MYVVTNLVCYCTQFESTDSSKLRVGTNRNGNVKWISYCLILVSITKWSPPCDVSVSRDNGNNRALPGIPPRIIKQAPWKQKPIDLGGRMKGLLPAVEIMSGHRNPSPPHPKPVSTLSRWINTDRTFSMGHVDIFAPLALRLCVQTRRLVVI